MIKTLNLNVLGTKRDVAPEQRPDRFPSVGDYIQTTPTFQHAWATPRHNVIGRFLEIQEMVLITKGSRTLEL